MNDYNRGALPVPCLRLDYGFGDEWASVELGDGTGYIKLSEYDMLCEMTDSTEMPRYDGMEYEELVAAAQFLCMENAKLLELENIRMSQARHCEDLDKENAKLRDEVTRLKSEWESERDYADQMEAKEKRAVAENDKLRELVRGLYWCNDKKWNKGACDDCPIRGRAVGRCERAMSKLGIEVTDA